MRKIGVESIGVTKQSRLNYEIQYKKGKKNIVADALSRRGMDQKYNKGNTGVVHSISMVKYSWLSESSEMYKGGDKVKELLTTLSIQPKPLPIYSYFQWIIKHKSRVYIGAIREVRNKLNPCMHASHVRGHFGIL